MSRHVHLRLEGGGYACGLERRPGSRMVASINAYSDHDGTLDEALAALEQVDCERCIHGRIGREVRRYFELRWHRREDRRSVDFVHKALELINRRAVKSDQILRAALRRGALPGDLAASAAAHLAAVEEARAGNRARLLDLRAAGVVP